MDGLKHTAPKFSGNASDGEGMDTIILTINEACAHSRTGRTALYAAIKSGRLAARKRGRRTMILANDLRAWIEALPKVNSNT
jgi:excisionase family DNA binding protein